MFGLSVEDITLQPTEIDGTVYVPIHVECDGNVTTTFVEYEEIAEQFDDDGNLGTDDFRYDP